MSRTVVVLVLALVSACSVTEPPAQRDPLPQPSQSEAPTLPGAPRLLDTGDLSERVTTLPVAVRTGPGTKRVVYSQEVDLQEGEVMLAVSEFQVTNDLDTNVYVGSMLLLGTSPTAVAGREVSAANGENVTPAMHHGQQTKTGTYRATSGDTGVRYVNLVVWAAASGASPGAEVAVDQGYGRLSVLGW